MPGKIGFSVESIYTYKNISKEIKDPIRVPNTKNSQIECLSK